MGGVQGKADVSALYTLISSILLESHNAITPGIYLQSYTWAQAIEHNNMAHSDHTDGHVSEEHNSDFPMESVI